MCPEKRDWTELKEDLRKKRTKTSLPLETKVSEKRLWTFKTRQVRFSVRDFLRYEHLPQTTDLCRSSRPTTLVRQYTTVGNIEKRTWSVKREKRISLTRTTTTRLTSSETVKIDVWKGLRDESPVVKSGVTWTTGVGPQGDQVGEGWRRYQLLPLDRRTQHPSHQHPSSVVPQLKLYEDENRSESGSTNLCRTWKDPKTPSQWRWRSILKSEESRHLSNSLRVDEKKKFYSTNHNKEKD